MATRIRLRKVGRKKQPTFRIVVAGGMHARSGRITETIGKYNPRTDPSYIEVDEKRALYWLRQGALVSEGVEPLFRKTGILKKFADGAEGEGMIVIGDAQGSTIQPPKAKRAKKTAAKAEEKPAEAAAPEPEAEAEAEPEAAAEAPEAEAEEEKQEAES
ncbi:MAG: 30S ribosomal protein S16 [Gemmatimonadales bacterium]|jgi:small subunit ribosomal protein S16